MNEEEKKIEDYISIADAAKELGLQRTSMHPYLHQLEIKPTRFKFKRERFISRSELERIKTARAEPWKLGLKKG